MERHKVSAHGVGHGRSKRNANDPHSGPMPGDASFRLYFVTAEAYQEAMRKAAQLEAKGLMRRAWRVRLNLDGPQPVYTPAMKIEEYVEKIEEGGEVSKVTKVAQRINDLIRAGNCSLDNVEKILSEARRAERRRAERAAAKIRAKEKK